MSKDTSPGTGGYGELVERLRNRAGDRHEQTYDPGFPFDPDEWIEIQAASAILSLQGELERVKGTLARAADWLSYFEEHILDENLLDDKLEKKFVADVRDALALSVSSADETQPLPEGDVREQRDPAP